MAQEHKIDEAVRPGFDYDAGHRVVLEMPASPEYVALSRLTIAALAGRFELDQEVAAELKLAVTEACSLFVGVGETPRLTAGLRVVFGVGEERWTITVTGPLPESGFDGTGEHAGLALVVIQALVDDFDVQTDGSTGVLRFGRTVR